MKTDFEGLKIDENYGNIMRATIQMAAIKAKKSPLIEYMQKNIKKEVNIEEVRSRLAKVTTSMAEGVIESRTERL